MIWTELNEIIEKNHSFLISSHENQDGDSVGSQLAFYKYLKSLGKNARIYNKDKSLQKFIFFKDYDAISNIEPEQKFDVLVLLDCSNPQRCGIENIETRFADKTVNIDHHGDNSMFATVNCVDVNAAATCKILYDFLTENRISYDCDIANYLLCGIITDTGGFHFNNADGELYLIAHNLVKRGADNTLLFKKMFASNTIAALSIRAKIWETLKFYADGKISVISMPKSLITDFGADSSATDGMSNAVLGGEGVEVGIFARYDENETQFSLRSAGKIDVCEIAASCGKGGGHKFAAGCTVKSGDWKCALENLITKIEQKLIKV